MLRAPLHAAYTAALTKADGEASVHLAVQVYDIIAAASSDTPMLAILITEVIWEAALGALSHGPRLAAAPDKVTALANDRQLLQKARRLFGAVACGEGGTVTRLGIDYVVGGRLQPRV